MSRPFCAKCYLGVANFDDMIVCQSCKKKFHINCLGLEPARLDAYFAMNHPAYLLCDECDRHARVNFLESQVVDLRHQVESIKQHMMFFTIGPLANEAADRLRRSKNLIVYNFPESCQPNEERRSDDDRFQIIREILSFCYVDVTNIRVSRLKPICPNVPRPLRVCFNSEDDVKVVLHNKQYCSPGLKFARDKTNIERRIYRDTKTALEMLKQQGHINKTIRFIRGIPVIVDEIPQQQDEARALEPYSPYPGDNPDDNYKTKELQKHCD